MKITMDSLKELIREVLEESASSKMNEAEESADVEGAEEEEEEEIEEAGPEIMRMFEDDSALEEEMKRAIKAELQSMLNK